MKNYLILGILGLNFSVCIAVGLYMFLNLHEKPYEFGIFVPSLIFIFILYYLLFFYVLYKYDKYKDHLNIVMDAF